VPAIQPYIIEPIFEQFEALLPQRRTNHPLGYHRPRVPDRIVCGKLLEILVFGCAYWRIADESCSESHDMSGKTHPVFSGILSQPAP
jgi:hypothetical protein